MKTFIACIICTSLGIIAGYNLVPEAYVEITDNGIIQNATLYNTLVKVKGSNNLFTGVTFINGKREFNQ